MMNELVTKQQVIDAVYEHEFSNWCDKDEVSTIVDELPPAMRWYPCEEQMPEEHDAGILKKLGIKTKSDTVLLTIESNGERVVDHSAYTFDGKWRSDLFRFI